MLSQALASQEALGLADPGEVEEVGDMLLLLKR
jgi:hypothetical protein